ncbi:hypothetical protein H5410_020906 [Solanum commersonii]|uniref:Uncharacterized protein n=1 Tax=Solanum commersonii TaxID=4109 RepID=A0A9J5Z9S5_SOLCO|nr:hypothetical protein H5410_020906 [Solanum commersonii]
MTEIELAKWNVPINKIQKPSINSGSIIPYKNSRHEWTFRTIILVNKDVIKLTLLLTLLFYRSCLLYLYPTPLHDTRYKKIKKHYLINTLKHGRDP